jgi:TonB family protein
MRAHESAPAANAAAHPKGEEPSLLDLVEARLNGGQILEPEHDNALYYLNELNAADPKNPELAQLASAVQAQILARATAAAAAGQTDNAKSLMQTAARLGPTPEIAALNERLSAPAKPKDAAPPAMPQVSASLLKETVRLSPDYPANALSTGTEGWVELAFKVLADGNVADVSVVDSMPPHLFDRAARDALLRTRYQPFTQDGRPIAVTSKIRVSFQLSNH